MGKYERRVENLEDQVEPEDGMTQADKQLYHKLKNLVKDFLDYVEEEKGDPKHSVPLEESCNLRKTAWEIARYEETGEFEGRFLNEDEFNDWLEVYRAKKEVGDKATDVGLSVIVHEAWEYKADQGGQP